MKDIELRDLKSIDDYRAVVEMEREIWGVGYDDVVPVPIFVITVKRGGVLIGAFDTRNVMVGFVYSLPGFKSGRPMQWSHMLGVLDSHRSSGLGRALKLAQRDRVLAQGLDLIEWTYDPLQALNAHLNFRRLGVVVDEYAVNAYGESTSKLHGSTPTDRFVASWYVRSPHVERRLAAAGDVVLRASAIADAPIVNRTAREGARLVCLDAGVVPEGAPRFLVEIPVGFTEMLHDVPDLAHRWRLAVREIFLAAFAKGYRVVDFALDRGAGRGHYVVAKPSAGSGLTAQGSGEPERSKSEFLEP